MVLLTANPIVSLIEAPQVSTAGRRQTKHNEYGMLKFSSVHFKNNSLKFRPLCIQSHPFNRRGLVSTSSKSYSVSAICAAAINSTCVATETRPLTRRQETATITYTPVSGKLKPPILDHGGPRLPPRGGGGGGGGGGGSGGNWSGGFFFFMFLVFLSFIKNKDKDDVYEN